MEVTRKRKILFGAATGIVVGFLYAAGSRLDRYDTLNLLEASFYLNWLGLSLAASPIILGIWWFADLLGRKTEKGDRDG